MKKERRQVGQRQSLKVVNLNHDIVPAQSFRPTHLNSQVRNFGPSEALHKELRMALAKHSQTLLH